MLPSTVCALFQETAARSISSLATVKRSEITPPWLVNREAVRISHMY
jgi:hypothetical protein